MHVNFDGKGVLTRTIGVDDRGDDKVLVDIFPMINKNEIFLQSYRGNGKRFISLAKKDILNTVDVLFKHYFVVSISLDKFVTAVLEPFVKAQMVVLPLSNVEFRQGGISEVVASSKNSSVNVIGSDEIAPNETLAYAGGVYLITSEAALKLPQIPVVSADADRFIFFRSLYKNIRFAIGIVLVVLLLNAMAFFILQRKTTELELIATRSSNVNATQMRDQERSSIIMSTYNAFGWRSNALPLFYCDQIASTVEDGVSLTLLEVGVFDAVASKNEKRPSYNAKLIRVEGTTTDPLKLHSLTESIRQLRWVKAVDNERYQHDRRGKSGVFSFNVYANDEF